MIIVAGWLKVDPEQRESYLADCRAVIEQARETPGCLDFTLSADLLDDSRINILERWASQEIVNEFRGSGVSDDQSAQIRDAKVSEFDVETERSLT